MLKKLILSKKFVLSSNIVLQTNFKNYSTLIPRLNDHALICDREWEKLKGIEINNNFVILHKCADIHPFDFGPIINCETVLLYNCNKNFIHYWLNHQTLPCVKNIFLFSHPCSKFVLQRWKNKNNCPNIYLSKRFEKFNEEINLNVQLLSDQEENNIAKKFNLL